MANLMPIAIYLATKFWMYITWILYILPSILCVWGLFGGRLGRRAVAKREGGGGRRVGLLEGGRRRWEGGGGLKDKFVAGVSSLGV